MELFDLKEKIEEVNSNIEYYKDEIERLETKVGVKASNISVEISKGGIVDRTDTLLELIQMSKNLDDAVAKLNNLTRLKDKKYNIYKMANDYDKQIYMEKKLFKWSNAKISSRHNGISKSQIYNIIKKIERVEKSGNHMK